MWLSFDGVSSCNHSRLFVTLLICPVVSCRLPILLLEGDIRMVLLVATMPDIGIACIHGNFVTPSRHNSCFGRHRIRIMFTPCHTAFILFYRKFKM